MSLQGKTVLVTGASGGIGRAIALRLAKEQASLLLVGRDMDALHTLQRELQAGGTHADVISADLLYGEGRHRVVDYCSTLPGGLFALVNNAGTNRFALFEQQREQDMALQVQLNLITPMLLIRELLPALRKAGEARILNIGSTFGSIGYPGYSVYCASKAGLRALTESLRRELADTPLKILYLAPRATRTSLNTSAVMEMNQALGNAMDDPEVVAEAVARMLVSGGPSQAFIGFPEKLFARLNPLLPGLVDGALRKQLATIKRFASRS